MPEGYCMLSAVFRCYVIEVFRAVFLQIKQKTELLACWRDYI